MALYGRTIGVKKHPARRWGQALLWGVLLLLWGVLPLAAQSSPTPLESGGSPPQLKGSVRGSLIGNPARGSLKGATVVLLWFRQGVQPAGGVLAKQVAGEGGSFAFTDVPIDPQARYQLGTRVEGRLTGSESFTLSAAQRKKTVNIHLADLPPPGESTLAAEQVLYALEPGVGRLWLTEVLRLRNAGAEPLSLLKKPLEWRLPPAAEELQLVQGLKEGRHEHIGSKLLIFGTLAPGSNTIALQYALDAPLGRISLSRHLNLPVGELLLLAEKDGLELVGPRIQKQEGRQVEDKHYQVWSSAPLTAGTELAFTVSGIAPAQQVLFYPLAAFCVLMAAVLFWFVRRRLA